MNRLSMAALRNFVAFLLWLSFASALTAQGGSSDKQNGKAIEAAVSFAQSLAQWEFIIVGASMLVLIGTSYYRPSSIYMRRVYLLFLPAWACLGGSIYFGTQAQRVYLAYLLLSATTSEGATMALNHDMGSQIVWMRYGLGFFAIWLVVYLMWWIFDGKAGEIRGGS